MVLIVTLIALVAIVAAAIVCFQVLPTIAAIIVVVIGAPLLLFVFVTVYGLIRRATPLRPFDEAQQQASAKSWGGEGRHIRTDDGRIVEYLVYGSTQPDAKIIVQMHGSTTTGAWQCKMYASVLETLNLKGIAPSVPNHGYSDIHIRRQLADFPRDLEHILKAEGVDEFMVEGASFGTGHAMAIAWHFGSERCVAMGLMVPYLSDQICREYNLESKADALPRADTGAWYAAWNFYVADLCFAAPLISPMAKHLKFSPDGKNVAERRPWIIEELVRDQRERLVARGTQGQGWEMFSFDVTVGWGFDPREIKTRNIAVWYALDDWACFPTHGEWLAEYFGNKDGVNLDVRKEEQGLGHYTYFPSTGPEYLPSEPTMAKALLDLCARQQLPDQ